MLTREEIFKALLKDAEAAPNALDFAVGAAILHVLIDIRDQLIQLNQQTTQQQNSQQEV